MSMMSLRGVPAARAFSREVLKSSGMGVYSNVFGVVLMDVIVSPAILSGSLTPSETPTVDEYV